MGRGAGAAGVATRSCQVGSAAACMSGVTEGRSQSKARQPLCNVHTEATMHLYVVGTMPLCAVAFVMVGLGGMLQGVS